MTRYSFILTTTLLSCVLVVVTEGRSVGSEIRSPEEFELDTKFDEDDDDGEARHMPDMGMMSGMGGMLDSSSMVDAMNSYIDEKIQMLNSMRPQGGSSSSDQAPNVILLSTGCGSNCGNAGAGGNTGDVGSNLPSEEALLNALLPEIVAAAVNAENEDADADADADTTQRRRRRRRRRRPVYISGNRRVSQKRRRSPSGRRVFVIRPSNIQ